MKFYNPFVITNLIFFIMSNNKLIKIATEYMQVWNSGKENILEKFAHRDLDVYYTHFEKSYHGIPEYKSMLKMTYGYFPDLSITLDKVVPNNNGNSVTVLWKYDGTHKNGNLFGVESSGKKVSVKGMTLLEIENGLVKKESGIVDNLSLIMQLGAFS
jgi:predicted ester cyclase